jgi:hypothetical protein
MPFNGNVFTRLQSWVANAALGLKIRADLMDQDTNDIAQAITTLATELATLTTNTQGLAVDIARYGAIYDGATDASAAFAAAFASNSAVQVSGQVLIKSQLLATGKQINMLAGAAIILDVTTFTGARNSATAVGVLFNGGTTGGIRGGVIRPSAYVDDLALVAVRMVSCSGVKIKDVEMSGFSKANGVVSIDTSNDWEVNGCYFHDCTTNSATTGQVTGVTVDDNRIGGVSSLRGRIYGNDFRDITVGAAFLALYGYQSDAITIEVGATQVEISDNTIFNVGEGIDYWGFNGAITGNVIRHCYNFGIKLIHGAQYNAVTGNSIYDSGLAGIIVSAAAGDANDTSYNVISSNNIAGIDGAGAWSASTTGCILVSDGTGTTFIPRNNTFADNVLNPGPGGKYCIVRSQSTDGTNVFPNQTFVASGSSGYVSDISTGLGRITATNKTVMRANLGSAQAVTGTTSAKLQLNTRSFDDRNEFDTATNFRWTCQIPGVYEVRGQVTLGTVAGANKIGVVEIRLNGSAELQLHALMTSLASYSVEDLVVMKAGDFLELWYTNGDTSSVTVNNGVVNTFMSVNQA